MTFLHKVGWCVWWLGFAILLRTFMALVGGP